MHQTAEGEVSCIPGRGCSSPDGELPCEDNNERWKSLSGCCGQALCDIEHECYHGHISASSSGSRIEVDEDGDTQDSDVFCRMPGLFASSIGSGRGLGVPNSSQNASGSSDDNDDYEDMFQPSASRRVELVEQVTHHSSIVELMSILPVKSEQHNVILAKAKDSLADARRTLFYDREGVVTPEQVFTAWGTWGATFNEGDDAGDLQCISCGVPPTKLVGTFTCRFEVDPRSDECAPHTQTTPELVTSSHGCCGHSDCNADQRNSSEDEMVCDHIGQVAPATKLTAKQRSNGRRIIRTPTATTPLLNRRVRRRLVLAQSRLALVGPSVERTSL